jgi:hypothetical protein
MVGSFAVLTSRMEAVWNILLHKRALRPQTSSPYQTRTAGVAPATNQICEWRLASMIRFWEGDAMRIRSRKSSHFALGSDAGAKSRSRRTGLVQRGVRLRCHVHGGFWQQGL